MQKWLAIVIPVVLLLILGGIAALLFWLGSDDQSALEKLRDITIIFLGLLWLIAILLLAALVGAMVWLVLTLRDKVVPVLESVNLTVNKIKETTDSVAVNVVDTSQRVKQTTEFVTEEVAAPLIKAYGLAAQGRAWVRVVTGRQQKPEGSPFSRAFRKPE
ncbi:MAG: hypothetical protein DCC58_02280 [Chloroflexi bacterium]|nr:MAG: hypothetical protein DCC58_02280 [Chloroflexota bacterium]